MDCKRKAFVSEAAPTMNCLVYTSSFSFKCVARLSVIFLNVFFLYFFLTASSAWSFFFVDFVSSFSFCFYLLLLFLCNFLHSHSNTYAEQLIITICYNMFSFLHWSIHDKCKFAQTIHIVTFVYILFQISRCLLF